MKAIDRERTARAELMTRLFRDRARGEQAYERLRARGYGEQEINVLTTDETRKKWYPTNDQDTNLSRRAGTNALEAAGVGGTIGGAVGALAALLAVASVAVPGVGPPRGELPRCSGPGRAPSRRLGGSTRGYRDSAGSRATLR